MPSSVKYELQAQALLYQGIVTYMSHAKVFMRADLRKGPLHAETEFLFLIVHNLKGVTATGLKLDITILQLLNYTCCKFRAPPTSGLGVAIASVPRSHKLAVLYLMLEPHHFR